MTKNQRKKRRVITSKTYNTKNQRKKMKTTRIKEKKTRQKKSKKKIFLRKSPVLRLRHHMILWQHYGITATNNITALRNYGIYSLRLSIYGNTARAVTVLIISTVTIPRIEYRTQLTILSKRD